MLNKHPVRVSHHAEVRTKPAPINPEWVIAGLPIARAATLSQSTDKDAVTVLWECTAGVFRWRFDADETVYIIEGAVTVHWNGERFTLNAGDTCYFPAGTIATWTVHQLVRKIAYIRVPPPPAINFCLRAFRAARRLFKSPVAKPVLAGPSPAAAE